ncbi:ABC transporter ATP-binding protein [Celeribacter litoreus]|uniref:ABC transporter ATP-binding protein n=1 Tax=Celeribacter litoreus TaxID=2876714 RepID=UPI001CCF6166|nr:ABC transporter ATP-binding protein [Celeribacter litoreus]MCA0042502.1 ABC transporter ATP-binding protein [Celeribacter litoreus]
MTNTSQDRILEVKTLWHYYGNTPALRGIDLEARRGEFVTLLGPSGSGKSTLLRILAGLELPTDVNVMTLDGQDVSNIPANRRNVSTVFQHYGLFPHLNVRENVEYGLRARKVPAADRRERALKMLEQVQLSDFAERPIARLSGGQKQRVAIARSLVLEPVILLLDEPLGALDEKLRIDMQVELLELQRRLEMTFIYVTHSQEEALTMSDRILLMNDGDIVQTGTPEDMFDRPNSRFSASFMGVENLFDAKVVAVSDAGLTVEVNGASIEGVWTGASLPSVGETICCGFRSERVQIADDSTTSMNSLEGKLTSHIYKGKYLDLTYQTALGPIRMRSWQSHAAPTETARIAWHKDQTILCPKS